MLRREAGRRAAGASASLGAVVLAALIPKCPLCVAAALSALGLGAAVSASLAPAVRPIGLALAVVAVVLAARGEWRRRRRRGCEAACRPAAARLDPRGWTDRATLASPPSEPVIAPPGPPSASA